MAKERFIAVKKDSSGNVIGYKSNTGKTYDVEMAKEVVLQDLIENASMNKDEQGNNFIQAKDNKRRRLKSLDK